MAQRVLNRRALLWAVLESRSVDLALIEAKRLPKQVHLYTLI